MIEAAFPLLGTAFVLAFVLPLLALVTKALLIVIERLSGGLEGLNIRYLVLMGSTALPLAWFVSAGLHQAETGTRSALACLFDHGAAALCFEPAFFALALVVAAIALAAPVLRKHSALIVAPASDSGALLASRLENILTRYPHLAELRGRVVVTDTQDFTLGTYGLLQPRVVVGTAFASRLSDEMIAGALGHEREHVGALDPLRYLFLQIALGVNPIGRLLLAPHVARWQAAREAHCDRQAVIAGAAPLALADAIVRAARPSFRSSVPLGAPNAAVLKFRVGLLLAFAEKRPASCCRQSMAAYPVGAALLFIALLLPHRTGTAALDALHTGAEQALTYFLR